MSQAKIQFAQEFKETVSVLFPELAIPERMEDDVDPRRHLQLLLETLTPIAKIFLAKSERGEDCTKETLFAEMVARHADHIANDSKQWLNLSNKISEAAIALVSRQSDDSFLR